MLFKEILEEKTNIIRPEIDKLLNIAWEKQNHIGDLLLFRINGSYMEDISLLNNEAGKKFNPHIIGPGTEGFSERAHYVFIHKYRTENVFQKSYKDYLNEIKWNLQNRKVIEEAEELEAISIQNEMLIYLKIWEADLIIKRFYQFARAINGEPYDWYFKLAESARDENCTGKRQDIIRLSFRDKIKVHSPILYQIIKNTYKTQIRNSIAHSKYSFLGRCISLNNFITDDPYSQLKGVSFDEWIDIFHNTIVLYNEYLRMNNLINEFYSNLAIKNNNSMEIQITTSAGKYFSYLEFSKEWKDWSFKIKD